MPVSPPRPSGPPLNALRAFEAAARHRNFVKAADELCVTPGAISQHIKTLEAWVGTALFRRMAQGVELTDAGAAALPGFSRAFDAMGDALGHLRAVANPARLHIAALPAIAQLWLSPRLARMHKLLPDVQISVTAVENVPNLRREPYDLTIFFEHEPDHPAAVDLGADVIFPAAAPMIARALAKPSDLAHADRLSDAVWWGDWDRWLDRFAPDAFMPPVTATHSLYAIALSETVAGAGVLMLSLIHI